MGAEEARLGVVISARARLGYRDVEALALRAEAGGFSYLFVNEAGNDVFAAAAAAVHSTKFINVATGVANIHLRHPAVTAASAAALAELSDGRFRLGLGVGHPAYNEEQLGISMRRPLSRLIEHITLVRALTSDDASVRFSGDFYTVRNPELNLVSSRAAPPIFAAALQPKAVTLLAPHVDGFVFNFLTPGYARMLADLADAHAAAPLTKIAYLHSISPFGTDSSSEFAAARLVARYGRHPAYRSMFRFSGFAADADRLSAAYEHGNGEADAVHAVSADLMRAVVVTDHVDDYVGVLAAEGVDVVAIHPITTNGAASVDAIDHVIASVAEAGITRDITL
jgi:5,10-methylenetetrahydromethanopterin reductase